MSTIASITKHRNGIITVQMHNADGHPKQVGPAQFNHYPNYRPFIIARHYGHAVELANEIEGKG